MTYSHSIRTTLLAAALMLVAALAPAQQRSGGATARTGDYIVAVVNQELVTNAEVEARVAQLRATLQRRGAPLPSESALRDQVVSSLVDERVIISHARDSGIRIDEPEVDRAVANIAAQNRLSLEQLREQLRRNGMDMTRLRANLRDQMMVERVREREVGSRIRVTDAEIDAMLEKQRRGAASNVELNIGHILVSVPENATPEDVTARQARIEGALARIKAGEAFEKVARDVSEDPNRERGGDIGMRSTERLPDLFVEAMKPLQPGEVTPAPLRSGAGFHLLKLIERKQKSGFTTTQTRARHILLRPSAQAPPSAVAARLSEFKQQIESSARTFDSLAREHSEDSTAPNGGDLGWASPGNFVPEFEQAMNALPVGGISGPVQSRFGMHLIQVVERRDVTLDARQVREQARNLLREQKFEPAYAEWVGELRARAYIEMREPPSQ
jgi:peptidyl-prolyl cis-trans isomerase SurA